MYHRAGREPRDALYRKRKTQNPSSSSVPYRCLTLKGRYFGTWQDNDYVIHDSNTQTGWIRGFSGGVEHTSVVSQLIKEVKETKGEFTCVWLNLANAYALFPLSRK